MATAYWSPEDSFAQRLRAIRRHLELSQEEAADRCGVNRKTWASWELGSSPRNMASVVMEISRGLCDQSGRMVDPHWLMWGTGEGGSGLDISQSPCIPENPNQGKLPLILADAA